MSELIGTIIKVRALYSNEETTLKAPCGVGESKDILELVKNRKYIIPDFQREIRWKKENIIELILDILAGEKFLGNIILTRSGNNYEIIDGQQRTTIILMLIQFIKSKYGEDIEVFETCDLMIDSFSGFSNLLKNNFDYDNLESEQQIRIQNSDKYNQLGRYLCIWKAIDNLEILQGRRTVKEFLKNLEKSELNAIVNIDDTSSGIEYFLDVNLKGVKLDTEDIFKGYLFSQDSSKEIRDKWISFKQKAIQFSNEDEKIKIGRQRGTTERVNKINYPLIKIIEHGLYCMLYSGDAKLSKLEFNEEFLLTKEVEISGEKHYNGEHIVKVLNSKRFMNELLDNIIGYEDFIINIISNQSYNIEFQSLFNKKLKIDSDEYEVMFNFIKKILRDNLEIPKILIMKYFFMMKNEDIGKVKDAHKMIYGIYVYAVLFTIFETKKGKVKILNIMKSNDWYQELINGINNYFEPNKITESRITVQYKYSQKEDEENYLFRCKSLATIYNFLRIGENNVSVTNIKDVLSYIKNDEKYSVEHFIVNDSGKSDYGTSDEICYSYKYNQATKKYINSLFNFIFINREINSAMSNLCLKQKLEFLKKNSDKIECKFSNTVIELAKKNFNAPTLEELKQSDDWQDNLEIYYTIKFKKEYYEFVNEIFNEIFGKFREKN